MRDLQDALVPQGFDAGTEERHFTLVMTDSTAALFVPVLSAALQRERAQVDLQVVGLGTRDPRPMLERGDADVAVGFFPEVGAALSSEGDTGMTRLEALFGCNYMCVMRRGHRLASTRPWRDSVGSGE